MKPRNETASTPAIMATTASMATTATTAIREVEDNPR
jgi:hypothetical protein